MFRKSTEQNFLALLFCFLVFAVSAFASATDLLISLADIATTDTARIRLLNTISWEFKSSDPQEAQRFADFKFNYI